MERRKWSDSGRYYRDGYRAMWGKHLNMLAYLVDCEDAGYPWVELKLRPKWQQIFLNEDWLAVSIDKYTGATAYKITLRGKQLLDVFVHKRRNDGLCPRCGLRPRKRYACGEVKGYCGQCFNEIRRNRRTDAPCVSCGKRPRALTKTGLQIEYCYECNREKYTEWRKKDNARRRARIEAGEVIMCPRCKERPVQVTARRVYAYCYECKNTINRAATRPYKRNRKLRIMRRAFKHQEGGD